MILNHKDKQTTNVTVGEADVMDLKLGIRSSILDM